MKSLVTRSELEKILQVMILDKRKGIGVLSLSNLTGVSSVKLRAYLASNRDYFVKIPESKTYAINQFGKFKGSSSAILKDHEQRLSRSHYARFWLLYFVIIATSGALIAIR